jgi:hypothetical protein
MRKNKFYAAGHIDKQIDDSQKKQRYQGCHDPKDKPFFFDPLKYAYRFHKNTSF